jgi:CBS domain containing-hemolysin-like protein
MRMLLRVGIAALAIAPALLFPLIGALFGMSSGLAPGRGEGGIRGGLLLGELFAFWMKKRGTNGNGIEHEDEPEFEITMASGEEVGDEEREYIENILEMTETTAQEVMTPRTNLVAIDAAWEPERVLETVASARHSRFPVYEETIDDVIGVLHMRDLLEHLARGEISGLDLRAILLEPIFIPASRKVDAVLRDLQRSRGHLAVVLDEYGGTAGILTIEDLLEEIVGEIQDEYDVESRTFWRREDGSYVVTAQMQLEDLEEMLHVRLEAEDVDTVGGFITERLGHIPKVREHFVEAGLQFTVLSVDKNRVGHVRIQQRSDAGVEEQINS